MLWSVVGVVKTSCIFCRSVVGVVKTGCIFCRTQGRKMGALCSIMVKNFKLVMSRALNLHGPF